jgi:hypothetical protein
VVRYQVSQLSILYSIHSCSLPDNMSGFRVTLEPKLMQATLRRVEDAVNKHKAGLTKNTWWDASVPVPGEEPVFQKPSDTVGFGIPPTFWSTMPQPFTPQRVAPADQTADSEPTQQHDKQEEEEEEEQQQQQQHMNHEETEHADAATSTEKHNAPAQARDDEDHGATVRLARDTDSNNGDDLVHVSSNVSEYLTPSQSHGQTTIASPKQRELMELVSRSHHELDELEKSSRIELRSQVPCADIHSQLMDCYQHHSHDSVVCSALVSEFTTCSQAAARSSRS